MFLHVKPGMRVWQWASGYLFRIGHDGVKVRESYPSITIKPGVAEVECLIAVENMTEGYRICPDAETVG